MEPSELAQRYLTIADLKNKDLLGIPWALALALRADGWYLRSDITWSKPTAMPESVQDRPTRSHEYVFLLSKALRYFYDREAVKELVTGGAHSRCKGPLRPAGWDPALGWVKPSRNKIPTGWDTSKGEGGHRRLNGYYGVKANPDFNASVQEITETRSLRDVWTIASRGFPGELCTACDRYYKRKPKSKQCLCGRADAWLAHFATFPPALVEKPLLAGTSEHGACAGCGAPWKRIVEKSYVTEGRTTNGPRSEEMAGGWAAGYKERKVRVTRTVGWKKSCKCETDARVPCIVLDPFVGSGTVPLVALRAGRRFTGIDLHEKYALMARARIAPELDQLRVL